MLSYAVKADIVLAYPDVLGVVLDYWEDDIDDAQKLVDAAQVAYDLAVSNGDPQLEIDALLVVLTDAQAALTTAQNTAQTNADNTIQDHLERAKGLIDECIPEADVEWVSVPRVLKDLSIDMAVYWCAEPADWRTDEMTKRWELAEKRLKMYCDGKITLRGGELPPDTEFPKSARSGIVIGTWDRG